jgi:hypothetical protein
MNRLGHYALDHAAYGFDHLAIGVLHRGEIWRNGSFRMLLPNRTSLNVHGFFQGIFQFIVVIGFIRINLTPFWEIQLKGLEYTHITVWPWHQVAFDRLTVFGDQEMKFEPINIAFLAGNVSPIGFMLVYLSPWNPVMVTHSDGKVIKDIDRFSVELLPGVSSEIKQPHEKIRETVEPMVLTTAAEHVWHIPRRAQEGTRRFKIAAKEPHGHQKPVVMTSASLICCGGSSAWPIAFKISALKQYTARILSSMGSLVFQEGSGLPPLTLEDEPHGCQ